MTMSELHIKVFLKIWWNQYKQRPKNNTITSLCQTGKKIPEVLMLEMESVLSKLQLIGWIDRDKQGYYKLTQKGEQEEIRIHKEMWENMCQRTKK